MHTMRFPPGWTYRGAESSCSLKASLVVCPSGGLHMKKLATASFRRLQADVFTIFTHDRQKEAWAPGSSVDPHLLRS